MQSLGSYNIQVGEDSLRCITWTGRIAECSPKPYPIAKSHQWHCPVGNTVYNPTQPEVTADPREWHHLNMENNPEVLPNQVVHIAALLEYRVQPEGQLNQRQTLSRQGQGQGQWPHSTRPQWQASFAHRCYELIQYPKLSWMVKAFPGWNKTYKIWMRRLFTNMQMPTQGYEVRVK